MPVRKITKSSRHQGKIEGVTYTALDALGSASSLAEEATRLYIAEVAKELEAGSYNLWNDLEIDNKNKEIRRRVLMSLLRQL